MFLTSCQSLPNSDRSSMAMGFAEAVYGLGVKFDGQHSVIRGKYLRRWDTREPVQLIVKGEKKGSDLYNSIVKELTDLYQLASIDLRDDIGLSRQLLRVTVKDESLLITKDIKSRCYTKFDYIKDNRLRTADIVVVRGEVIDKSNSCLLHEGMHSLGFAGHPHRLNSVLSYTQGLVALSNVDKKLINMLYSKDLEDATTLDDALTIAYSRFNDFPNRNSKRFTPVDISLELKEDESPVVLSQNLIGKLSKQFLYKIDKKGNVVVSSHYGYRGSGSQFANVNYTRLSSELVFKREMKLPDYVKNYEPYLGKLKQKQGGNIDNKIGTFRYMIAESSKYSCVFTIKYIDTISKRYGGHKVIAGNYCSSKSASLGAEEAKTFIEAIRLYERDPLEIRERKVSSRRKSNDNLSALRLLGTWPVDDSPVSGLKLFVQNQFSGKMKITVKDEICEGMLTNIQSNGLGKWSLDCEENESAKGRFSWDTDGTMSFRGETSKTGAEINWTANQIF